MHDALGAPHADITIWYALSSLENELSIKLLTHSRRSVKLTIEGAELYPFIERTICQYQAMCSEKQLLV